MTKILCLEGIVGAGKTTQGRFLEGYLTSLGFTHLLVNEKTYPPFREVVLDWHRNGANQYFSKEDIIRFAKARAEVHRTYLLPQLELLDYLIFDRSYFTSAVYQCNNQISYEDIIKINLQEGAIKIPIGFILVCEPKIAISRIEKRRKEKTNYLLPSMNETLEDITKRRELYIELSRQHPELHLIDTTHKSEEEVFEEIKNIPNL